MWSFIVIAWSKYVPWFVTDDSLNAAILEVEYIQHQVLENVIALRSHRYYNIYDANTNACDICNH